MAQREELEARLKERRLAEATKKGLVGMTGKIGTVLRTLGGPIVAQTENAAYLDTEGGGDDETNDPLSGMPVMYMDGVSRPEGVEWSDPAVSPTPFGIHNVGWHFDGLGRGMHMEIFYKDESSEMSLYCRGYMVYREIQGDLVCYVPSDEWEGWIASLFKLAKKVQREDKEREFQSKIREAERGKTSWLRDLASRWGIT
jgi:hypothetical protein